ncbi:putative lipid II flippase FtsW [Modestobacter sp. NPDC049651]|uniref:putative lipid II flippase FtsW n=1 Tax=unclassified Modestobacter TaxID=2643866 RepID=UPI0033FEB2B8
MTASTRERPAAARTPRPTLTVGGLRLRAPEWLEGPMTSSHLVLGSAGLLLAIGLVMVFSASSIDAAKDGLPVWVPAVRQTVFALIGLVAMLVALRVPTGKLRRWSGRGMVLSLVLLAVVAMPIPGLTLELNGSRAWFNLGVTNFQPSELAKLVFALWGAHVIALRARYLTSKGLALAVVPMFGLMSLLLLLEPDMGAVVSLGLVLAGLLWAGGLGWRWIAGGSLGAALLVVVMIASAGYRTARITSFIDPCSDAADGGYQACHGLYALASGGVWGKGLGNSAMKWNLLPHAESDYIFAIIGEELGFLGCCVVVFLYGVLAWAGFRIARRAEDRFVQLASVGITVWLIGQATMNMGYVVGLLPVTGVQLPLISAGGTSLVLTLLIIGLLARFARSEPAAVAHLRTQPRSRLAKLLLPAPAEPVDPLPSRRRRPPARERAERRPAEPVPRQRSAGRRTPGRTPGRTVARVPERGGRMPRPVDFERNRVAPARPDPERPPLRHPEPVVAERVPFWAAPVERDRPAARQTVRRQAAADRPLRRSADGPSPRTTSRPAPRTERPDPSDLPAARPGRPGRG